MLSYRKIETLRGDLHQEQTEAHQAQLEAPQAYAQTPRFVETKSCRLKKQPYLNS